MYYYVKDDKIELPCATGIVTYWPRQAKFRYWPSISPKHCSLQKWSKLTQKRYSVWRRQFWQKRYANTCTDTRVIRVLVIGTVFHLNHVNNQLTQNESIKERFLKEASLGHVLQKCKYLNVKILLYESLVISKILFF